MSDELGDTPPSASQAKIQFVVAEYQWVAGLVRYYREVELKVLAATGILLSGVVAGFTALRAGDTETTHEQALLLSLAAWVPAVSLIIVLMATLRGYRAVVYIRDRLHPLAVELADNDRRVLAWESSAQQLAFNPAAAERSEVAETERSAAETDRAAISPVLAWLVTGFPVLVLITLASVVLAIVGFALWPQLVTAAIGFPAAALAIGLAVYGATATRFSQRGLPLKRSSTER